MKFIIWNIVALISIFTLISCGASNRGITKLNLASDGVFCVEPPPDVVTTGIAARIKALVPDISKELQASIGAETTVARIRKEIPNLHAIEVLHYRLCIDRANGHLSKEGYEKFVESILPALKIEQSPKVNGSSSGSDKSQTSSPPIPRGIEATISAPNGERWGGWSKMESCGHGQFGIGLNIRSEKKQGNGDDTALNAIQLICGDTVKKSTVTPHKGLFGDWMGERKCPPGSYIASFTLRVEPSQGDKDDTGANNIKFGCRKFDNLSSAEYKPEPNIEMKAYTGWGQYGQTRFCPKLTAVCGLEVLVEPSQGRGDDTALNNVNFRCCDASLLL